jgi:F-type H+-transporting ATPase subunit a
MTTRRALRALACTLAIALATAPLGTLAAQGHEPTHTATETGQAATPVEHAAAAPDIITPHITDAPHMELPYWKPPFYKEVHLPHWKPIVIGGVAFDLSPTKHVVMLLLAATICALVLIIAARAHERHTHAVGRP